MAGTSGADAGLDVELRDYDSDPEEAVISLRRGRLSRPFHPRDTNIFKLCLLGAKKVGKTALATRLVTHSFETVYRPTGATETLFCSLTEPERPQDVLVEIEDLPGIEIPEGQGSGNAPLTAAAEAQLKRSLEPLLWFEKRRKQTEGIHLVDADEEEEPLLGAAGASKRNPEGKRSRLQWLWKWLDDVRGGKGLRDSRRRKPNPIAASRKRMGFVVVADVSSAKSFLAAYAIVDQIFSRLQFDVSDDIFCPVAVVLVGNKCDLRGSRRDSSLGTPAEMREQVERRYENVDRELRSVSYMECSASTSAGVERLIPMALDILRNHVPSRAMIRASRLRDRGRLGQLKRRLYTATPLLFEVDDYVRSAWRRSAKLRRRLDVGSYFYHGVFGPNGLVATASRRSKRALTYVTSWRWATCWWCPAWVQARREAKLKAEDAPAEEDLEETAT